MSAAEMKFSVSLAKDAKFEPGLRPFLEYRELGIKQATHGQFKARVIRVKKGEDHGSLHNELDCSDDLELLEITSPGDYATAAV